MLFQTRMTRRWFWVLAALLMMVACDDDDGMRGNEADGGLSCNPALGGVGNCTCITGTPGVHYCSQVSETWGACMCNEPHPPDTCTEGEHISCECPDGTLSYLICRASNTRDPCMCTSHMIMDSGTDDAGEVDSGPLDSGRMDGAFFDGSDNDAA